MDQNQTKKSGDQSVPSAERAQSSTVSPPVTETANTNPPQPASREPPFNSPPVTETANTNPPQPASREPPVTAASNVNPAQTAPVSMSSPPNPPAVLPADTNQTGKHRFLMLPVLIAVLVISLGIFLSYMYIRTRADNNLHKAPPAIPAVTETVYQEPPMFLNVQTENETYLVDGEMLVKGNTLPSSTVAVYSDIDEDSVESDADGNFETVVNLPAEGGFLTVTAFSQGGEEKTVTLDVNLQPEI